MAWHDMGMTRARTKGVWGGECLGSAGICVGHWSSVSGSMLSLLSDVSGLDEHASLCAVALHWVSLPPPPPWHLAVLVRVRVRGRLMVMMLVLLMMVLPRSNGAAFDVDVLGIVHVVGCISLAG